MKEFCSIQNFKNILKILLVHLLYCDTLVVENLYFNIYLYKEERNLNQNLFIFFQFNAFSF